MTPGIGAPIVQTGPHRIMMKNIPSQEAVNFAMNVLQRKKQALVKTNL